MHSMTYKNQLSHLLGDCVKHRIARIWGCLSATTNLAAASYDSVSTHAQTAPATTLQRFQLRNLG